ncbi:N-acetylglucosamine-1-phosphate uridyltransferase / Glucosamine-1-phosphate N-acetyltransferase [hydrothermal vent metagenome]|uniref:N-acetylglucosamine-1-phosphate uridyltransferase / Glucosamine-1-phosphate N-acetyltransferase n=1 Tax=hydrothermal vent metagenome TaxID=652676 RepID=A0A3B0XH23_9ZZZZ
MILRSLILVLLTVNLANASVPGKEFSADAVMTIPAQQKTMSKLFVGHNVVRTEVNTQNGLMIDIVFPSQGKLIKLNTGLKQYTEIPIEKQSADRKKAINPCSRIKNATCTQLGKEEINGQSTQKWQVISIQQGKNVRTLHWIDANRQLAVREFFNDGSMAEMTLEKIETINNRKTEKWIRTISRPDGSTVSSYQWYDPQLEISIKEELPGGYTRELKNIKLGTQKPSLFEIPDGYEITRQTIPAANTMRPYR